MWHGRPFLPVPGTATTSRAPHRSSSSMAATEAGCLPFLAVRLPLTSLSHEPVATLTMRQYLGRDVI